MKKRSQQISRFLVPFSFSSDRYFQLTETISKQQERIWKIGSPDTAKQTDANTSSPLWHQKILSSRDNEFFPFIKDSLNPQCAYHIGSLWELRTRNDQRLQGQLFYTTLPEKGEASAHILCRFSNAGLAIFRTGIGLAWFELSYELWPQFPQKAGAGAPSPRQVAEVNNYCKDLCHRNSVSGRNPLRFYPWGLSDEKDNSTEPRPAQDFSIFSWLWDFSLSELAPISFFSPRKQPGKQIFASTQEPQEGPDKAHIFTALHLRQSPEKAELHQLLYWLRRGYRPSYLPSLENLGSRETTQIFENLICGVCLEGCAFLAHDTQREDTNRVFADHFISHMIQSYFILYLISLHQYYVLLDLSARMAQLPDRASRFDLPTFQRLVSLREELGLAYTKAFFPQVSYVGHQNQVYTLFRESLSISELQEELSIKADTLTELTQAYRERQQERRGRIIAVCGGVFAVIETLATTLGMYDMLVPMERWIFSLLAMSLACAVGILLARFWK